ncbi:MAG: PEP-CTERM sorting domain-containing protein [Bryobacteraceae bacterium]|nr:PEP-CTERM sorting domain-containing protein [Bryobacteraceae bacterium]
MPTKNRLIWLLAAATIATPALAAPIFNPGSVNVGGGSFGQCQGTTSPISPGSSVQASGTYSCANGPFFPSGPGWGGGIAPFVADISGTGSGTFDSNYFPIGFNGSGTINGVSGTQTMNATLKINGQTVRTGSGQAFWDVGPSLTGLTLSTWQFLLQVPGQNVTGTGQPPQIILSNYNYCVWIGTNRLCSGSANNAPTNPILPDSPTPTGGTNGAPASWVFSGVPSGRWTDPPFVDTFEYTGTGGTMFDRITLPTGYGNSFTVWTGAGFVTSLGTFAGGATVDFAVGGVSAFQIRGINPTVDAALANAFPLQVFFEGGGSGSFNQTPIENTVPEPATWLMLTVALPCLGWVRRRRK